jgi:prepilin-type N-terminal cleavage/methylation domain-containing protein
MHTGSRRVAGGEIRQSAVHRMIHGGHGIIDVQTTSRIGATWMRRRGDHQGQTGLTWLELLVALAVLGVALAVAIPGYRSYVLRMNRGDAARDLRTVATQLQRCFARTGDYRLEASGTRDAYAAGGSVLAEAGRMSRARPVWLTTTLRQADGSAEQKWKVAVEAALACGR